MKNRVDPNLAGTALISSVGRAVLLRETIREPSDLPRTMETRGNLATSTPYLPEWPTGGRQLPIP
jgi:hypothetical protein